MFLEGTALFILLLPGLLWLAVMRAPARTLPEQLADAIGISLALPALAGLGTFLAGGALPGWLLAGLYALLGILFLGILFARRKNHTPLSHFSNFEFLNSNYFALLAFVLILGFRFYQARDLAVPAWVDSLHHTLIVRLILERGGIPATLQPYIPAPFYYHFGFHANAALFAFFARLTPDRAVLVFGQVLNAAVALAIYRLGMALWDDWRRAGAAMLLVGFVSQMPAYYVTWGRYTLLAGVILLALAMASALEIIRQGANRERVARLAVLTGGLLLTHYFAAALLALFFAVLALERWVFGEVSLPGLWSSLEMRGLFMGALAGALLAAPWVWHVWQNAAAFVGVRTVAIGQPLEEAYFSEYLPYLWYLLGPRRSHVLLLAGLASLLLIGWRAKTRPLALWAVALGISSLPWGVHLAPFRPDHGVIVAFLPASLLVADAFISPLGPISPVWFSRFTRGIVWVGLLGLLIWGVGETRNIVNPVTVIASDADLQAMDWIRENTPLEALFYTNTAFWQGNSYRGVDGGWWITPLTGRRTLLPPALYITGPQEYVQNINNLAGRAAQIETCSDDFWALVEQAGIGYLYLVSGKGSLQRDALAGCQGMLKLYDQGGVAIFRVSAQR